MLSYRLSLISTFSVPSRLDLNRGVWQRCNNLVHSWLINSVSSPIVKKIAFLENTIDVQQDLKERFSKLIASVLLIYVLRSIISSKAPNLFLITLLRYKDFWKSLVLKSHCQLVHVLISVNVMMWVQLMPFMLKIK